SVAYLVRTLFALHGRRAPHHDRLVRQLAAVDGLGWPPGELAPRLLELVRTADPGRQQALEAEVEALMRAHGYGDVLDAWGGELDRVRAGRGA
ncbi:MAG TPA: hypothetical protein VGL23_19415, partial [Chloroflexota bacterium]